MKNQPSRTLISQINNRLNRFVLINFVIIFGVLFFTPVYAEDNIDVNLRIETPNSTILNQSISVPESCEVTDITGVTSTFTGYKAICVLQSAQEQGILSYRVTNWGTAFSIDSINEFNNAFDWSETWLIYKNNLDPGFGIDGFDINPDDTLLLTYGPWPMEPLVIELSTTTTYLGDTLILSTKYWSNGNLENYTNEITFIIDNTSYTSASGTLNYTPDTEGQKEIYIETIGKTRSEKVYLNVISAPEPEPTKQVNLNLRYQNSLIFSGQIEISNSTTIIDSTGIEHFTTSTNVLAALLAADNTSTDFNITDLQYYDSYGSFYLNCIDIYSPTTTSLCANWNYVVNNIYPNIGMDTYPLEGEENIYIYFDNPWQITASTSTFSLNSTTTLYTWRYDYENLNNNWLPDENLIDISIDNPNSTGWWDETITVATTTSNIDGFIDYKFSNTGTYYAKITSDDYSKWSNLITLTINESNNITDNDDIENSSEGDSSNDIIHNNLNIDSAINFLNDNENAGILGSSIIYTDWAGIAFGAYDKNHQTAQNIKNYLLTDPNPLIGLNNVSDYARRAMALMSLGINPYSDTATNYISNLVAQFDGNQFGDINLYNDDIFAIIPLLHAGYNSEDEIINKTVQFILSKQSNGGWGSVDLTAAAIQSLSPLTNIPGVSEALSNAKNKLQESQTSTGSFGNTPATAWVIQAINSLGDNQVDWQNNNKTPDDYLYSVQASDGGLDEDITNNDFRIWNTAYAIPAALDKDWNDILYNFEKPNKNNVNESSTTPENNTTTSTPTTPLEISTTTIEVATTTPDIVTTTLEILETPTSTTTPTTTPETTTSTENIINTDNSPTTTKNIITKYKKPLTLITTTEPVSSTPPTDIIITSPSSTIENNAQEMAKKVFTTSAGMGGSLLIYLIWKIIKTLV